MSLYARNLFAPIVQVACCLWLPEKEEQPKKREEMTKA